MAGQILQVCENFNLKIIVHKYRAPEHHNYIVLEINMTKGVSNKTPSTDSISVSDVLYQLSSLRKVSSKRSGYK